MMKKNLLLLLALVPFISMCASKETVSIVREMLNRAGTQEGRVLVEYYYKETKIATNFWTAADPVPKNPQSMPAVFDLLKVYEPVFRDDSRAIHPDYAVFPFVPHGTYVYEDVADAGTYVLTMDANGDIQLSKDDVMLEPIQGAAVTMLGLLLSRDL